MNFDFIIKTSIINSGLKYTERSDMLSFGTDAILISAFAGTYGNGSCADFGSGTGIISLLLAKSGKFTQIDAVERNEELLPLLQKNIIDNSLNDIISVSICDVRDYKKRDFDCIVTNPPYMQKGSGIENADSHNNDARRENYGTVFDFVSSASKALKPEGKFFCINRPERLGDLIFAMKSNKIEPKRLITVYHTANKTPCLVMAGGVKTGKPSLCISKPLVLYNEDGTRTKDCEYIYENLLLPNDLFGKIK